MRLGAWLVTILPYPVAFGIVAFRAPSVWGPFELAAVGLLWSSLLLVTRARLQLGDAFSVRARASKLVTEGLYSRIRNPIYVFGTLHVLAIAMLLGRPEPYIAVALLVVIQLVRARRESEVLEARFGDEYRAY